MNMDNLQNLHLPPVYTRNNKKNVFTVPIHYLSIKCNICNGQASTQAGFCPFFSKSMQKSQPSLFTLTFTTFICGNVPLSLVTISL